MPEESILTETPGEPETQELETDVESESETSTEETTEQAQEQTETTTEEKRPFFEYGDEKFETPENLSKFMLAHERRLFDREQELRQLRVERKTPEVEKPVVTVTPAAETDYEAEYANLPDPNEDWDGYLKGTRALELKMAREIKSLRTAKTTQTPDIERTVKEVIQRETQESQRITAEQQKTKDFDNLLTVDPDLYGVTDDLMFILSTPSHPEHQKAMNLRKVAEYVGKGLSVQDADFLVSKKARTEKPVESKQVSPATQVQDQLRRSRTTVVTRPPQSSAKTKEITTLDEALREMGNAYRGQ